MIGRLRNLEFRCRPIDKWPGKLTPHRSNARFSAKWSSTLDLLATELQALKARDPILLLALTEDQITVDCTRPKATARPDHPGVILAFGSKYGPLRYACDRFPAWQDNIRAIALGLEALRKVDRYGITHGGEQYRGWRALPGPVNVSEIQTAEEAAEILALWAREGGLVVTTRLILDDPETRLAAYRRAVKHTHPDAGGDAEAFRKVQEAKAVLEAELKEVLG